MSRSRQQLSPQEADLLREARGSVNLRITDRGPHSHPRFRDEVQGTHCVGEVAEGEFCKHRWRGRTGHAVCIWSLSVPGTEFLRTGRPS